MSDWSSLLNSSPVWAFAGTLVTIVIGYVAKRDSARAWHRKQVGDAEVKARVLTFREMSAVIDDLRQSVDRLHIDLAAERQIRIAAEGRVRDLEMQLHLMELRMPVSPAAQPGTAVTVTVTPQA